MTDEPGGAAPFAEQAAAVGQLRSWVQSNAGITFSDEQAPLFRDRVLSLCGETGVSALQLWERVAGGDRRLALRVAEVASTNYTYFFREPEAFALFREHTLRDFAREPQLRVWSAASSSGDEAYSIAITAHEALGDVAYHYVRVLGTDISGRALKLAEEAAYPNDQLSDVSPERRARYFQSAPPHRFALQRAVRDMCMFRRLNLTQGPWPFEHRFHAIFLRNVLYYFDEHTRAQVLERCYDAIEPGGYLFTSLTEPLMELRTRFQLVRPAVYRRSRP